MLTGKQRSFLKSIAHNIDPIFSLGKGGISENFIKQIDEALEKREIVKVNILQNSDYDAKEAAIEVCEELGCEFVQAIGSRFVVYRQSKKHKQIDLPK